MEKPVIRPYTTVSDDGTSCTPSPAPEIHGQLQTIRVKTNPYARDAHTNTQTQKATSTY